MKFLAQLGRKASSEGIRMGLLLAGEPIPLVADAFRNSGIAWWSLSDWKTEEDKERRWRFITGFRRINALEPWDVVSFNHCMPVSVICACTWSRIRDGRRFARVWHQHQGVPDPRGIKKYVSTLRLLGPFMNALAATSDFGTGYYKERHCDRNKITVVYTGVRVPENQSQGWLRPKLGLEDSVRFLVTIASLIPRKGLDVLLQAVSVLLKEHREWHLLIVGGGPLLGALQEQARQLGIEHQTHFLGISNNVMEILADCNAFVLPSRNEDLPGAVLEAMASSLPVVATDVGSVRELVIQNKTGFLVAPEDPAGLRSALRSILLDEKLAHDLGRRGRERAETVFSLDKMVDGYLNLFREVCR